MPQAISVRDLSTPGNGRRVFEVTIDDLPVRVVVGPQRGSSEELLAAAFAVEVAERIAEPDASAAIEIRVPDKPGPANVTRFPLARPSSR